MGRYLRLEIRRHGGDSIGGISGEVNSEFLENAIIVDFYSL